MKDAKGHGSDPRGGDASHQAGINRAAPAGSRFMPIADIWKANPPGKYLDWIKQSDMAHVEKMRETLRSGKHLPPLILNPDKTMTAGGGHHRLLAYEAEGYSDIPTRTRKS